MIKKRRILDEMMEEYCRSLYENERSRGTIEKYYGYLKAFQKYMDGKCVKKEAVIVWKEQLKERFSAVTVNVALSALNGFFQYYGWNDCVARFVRTKRALYWPESRMLSRKEYECLVKKAQQQKKERLALLLQTVCSTGIRISELQFITVEAVKQRFTQVECKGRTRTIFLPEKLCMLLEEYTEKHGIKTGMVFVTRNFRPVDRSNIWREMKKLGDASGVACEKIFPHNLRHLFARSYYDQEHDLSRLADILGHSSVNTTRIYTVESGRNHRKQLEQLGLVVDGKRQDYNRISLLL